MLSSQIRSGGGAIATDGHETTPIVVLVRDGKLVNDTVAHGTAANLSTVKAALMKAGRHDDYLSPKPQSRRQAMISPE